MIRTAKCTIPASVQPEFNDYINTKGLKGVFTPIKDDMCLVEITYTKNQTGIIDEIEEAITVFTALALVCVSALSSMVSTAQISQDKK
ncbi:MAG TPA: hypothetical protein VF411_06395 [Bacteroidia bacterium]